MNPFWDAKYNEQDYIYGKNPNAFLAQKLNSLDTGRMLVPADGEGRNGVYAASLGWEVTTFDPSDIARKKAHTLAVEKGVTLNILDAEYESFEAEKASFDCLVLVFAHMPPLKRRLWHTKLTSYLKPGGILLLQGFHKNQLGLNSGGPKDMDMLFNQDELTVDFADFSELKIEESSVILQEGSHHKGKAEVISVWGKK